jgi:hypothetical protein
MRRRQPAKIHFSRLIVVKLRECHEAGNRLAGAVLCRASQTVDRRVRLWYHFAPD